MCISNGHLRVSTHEFLSIYIEMHPSVCGRMDGSMHLWTDGWIRFNMDRVEFVHYSCSPHHDHLIIDKRQVTQSKSCLYYSQLLILNRDTNLIDYFAVK